MHNAVVTLDSQISARLKRNADGLVCAVVQQHDSREVLMVGWIDDEALRRTLVEGRVTFWSRSRREYWRKGDTSGHAQYVKSVHLDCDGDALLIEVDQVGAACHTGERSCFLAGGDLGAHRLITTRSMRFGDLQQTASGSHDGCEQAPYRSAGR